MDTCCEPHARQEKEQASRPDPPKGLKEREFRVLIELARGDDVQVGFQGLKRRLGLHQETLRRTLKSLGRMGFVDKREHGYGLTEKAQAVLQDYELPLARRSGIPVANLLLPTGATPDLLVENLAHRWFDGLRWFGVAQGPGEAVLMWEADGSDARVHLKIGLGSATAEVVACPDEDECLRLAGTVVSALLESLQTAVAEGPSFAA